jgi:hypothetical protein
MRGRSFAEACKASGGEAMNRRKGEVTSVRGRHHVALAAEKGWSQE